jgi:hypothetical protein
MNLLKGTQKQELSGWQRQRVRPTQTNPKCGRASVSMAPPPAVTFDLGCVTYGPVPYVTEFSSSPAGMRSHRANARQR